MQTPSQPVTSNSPREGRRRLSPRRVLRHLCQAVLALAAVVLLATVVGPRFLPYEALIVRSGSMSPTIPTGSVVFYHREAADSVKVGQIIAFVEPGRPGFVVTHRVHAIESTRSGRYFITKGDANAVPDDWQVPASGVGWVAAYHLPYIGYGLSWLATSLARILLITVPALGLGILLLLDQRPPRRQGEALAS